MKTTYGSAIGNLIYLAICTKSEILFSVSKTSRRSKNPNTEDWENVIKIFRYLKRHLKLWILFTKKGSKLNVYVDADYSGDKKTKRSNSGGLLLL